MKNNDNVNVNEREDAMTNETAGLKKATKLTRQNLDAAGRAIYMARLVLQAAGTEGMTEGEAKLFDKMYKKVCQAERAVEGIRFEEGFNLRAKDEETAEAIAKKLFRYLKDQRSHASVAIRNFGGSAELSICFAVGERDEGLVERAREIFQTATVYIHG